METQTSFNKLKGRYNKEEGTNVITYLSISTKLEIYFKLNFNENNLHMFRAGCASFPFLTSATSSQKVFLCSLFHKNVPAINIDFQFSVNHAFTTGSVVEGFVC